MICGSSNLIPEPNVLTCVDCIEQVIESTDNQLQGNNVVDLAELHRINVSIEGAQPHRSVKELEDLGTQSCVIRSVVFRNMGVERVGSVKLCGVFGSPVRADLIRLRLQLNDEPLLSYVPVNCAVGIGIHEELILNVDAINHLFACRD